MNQLFIPHELALKAKSKGFTNQCMAIYDEKGTFAFQPRGNCYQNSKEDTYNCAATIYQQIFEQIFHSTVIIQSLTKNQLRERIHNAQLKDIRYSGNHKGFYSLAPKGVKVVI